VCSVQFTASCCFIVGSLGELFVGCHCRVGVQSLFGKEADKLEHANDDEKICILCYLPLHFVYFIIVLSYVYDKASAYHCATVIKLIA